MYNLGCGTGRCGTKSLARLLKGEHELKPILPWRVNQKEFEKHFKAMEKRSYVAFYYIKYIDKFIEHTKGNIRIVCLKRNREDTVNSYLRKVGNKHHWVRHNIYEKNDFECAYPKYDFKKYSENKREAIAKYWDSYYKLAEEWDKKYPKHFKIFGIEDLNTRKKQKEILKFCGLRYNFKKIHLNAQKNSSNNSNNIKG